MTEPTPAAALTSDPPRMQWGVKIPLRDGVRLNGTLYLPGAHHEPGPAILTLTPYTGQIFHQEGVYFSSHGYGFLSVDVRGRGNSEGSFRPLIDVARDVHDVVEWIARQPWCNGQVTMWGGSYCAHVQWAAVKEMPAHLVTMVPAAPPYIGVDFPIRNNMASPYWMKWLTLVWGHTLQDKLFWGTELFWGALFRRWHESGAPLGELDAQLGIESATFQEWLSHPHQDAYWDSHNPSAEQYAALSIPVLTITGSYDADQPGALMHYKEHLRHNRGANHYLVIGPWDHAGTRTPAAEFCGLKMGPASLVDLRRLHLDWYRWTMRGGPRPAFLQNKVAYYVMGAEKWRYADCLDDVTARSLPLYLQSTSNPTDVFHSGTLGSEPATRGEPDHYVYDPRDVSLAALESSVDPESRVDHRLIYAAVGKQLVYHSPPFEAATEISGFFRLTAWLAIDQPDTDFRAIVYEIGLDGSAIELSTDSFRARYRENPRQPQLIDTQQPLRYDFERFTFVSRQVQAGHRLRLVFGPINSIYAEKNYNSGGVVARESIKEARTVTVRLFHDESHASVLHVPLGYAE